MKKLIRDGKVAVLYSPGYGAGFYTDNAPVEAIFDPKLVELVEKEQLDEVINYVKATYPNAYNSGVHDLKVTWLPEGTKFFIEEYDGSEYFIIMDDVKWITA